MLTKEFQYESASINSGDLCNMMSVEINIIANEADYAEYEIESIYDETMQVFRNLNDFSKEEQLAIDKKAQKLAEDYGHETYVEYMTDQADFRGE